MKDYKCGRSFLAPGNQLKTYTIDELTDGVPLHNDKIHVFGDVKLRNTIVKLLKKEVRTVHFRRT